MKSIFDVRDYEYIEHKYYVPNTDIIVVYNRNFGMKINIERKISDENLIMYDAIDDAPDCSYEKLLKIIDKKFCLLPINARTMHAIGNEIQNYYENFNKFPA